MLRSKCKKLEKVQSMLSWKKNGRYTNYENKSAEVTSKEN